MCNSTDSNILNKPIDMNKQNSWAESALEIFSECVEDKRSGCKVFHVRDFHTFIRAIGKVKYLLSEKTCANGNDAGYALFFRGQSVLKEGELRPSYYRVRPRTPHISKENLDKRMDLRIKYLQQLLFKNKLREEMREYDTRIIEGLFQHYGMGSRWIDAVDNIWIALWFACHNAWQDDLGLVHYEKRFPSREKESNRFCYILLLGAETTGMKSYGISGLRRSEEFEILDLRYALASYFLRPHVQHGVLIRVLGKDGRPALTMGKIVKGVIRIDLVNALDWLGNGLSISVNSMFPAPVFDTGYDSLLRAEVKLLAHKDCRVEAKRVFPFYV